MSGYGGEGRFMNILKWVPWKYFIRRTARAHGFLDPINLLAKVRQFAQPSEVTEPVELLRAGAYFHARGLINARVIQQNLDWIWPFWVEKQFNPESPSFLPRAFSLTHVNLTHRNWTAVGIPGWDGYPVIDPRGLVTPYWDGWSIDSWLLSDEGEALIPSQLDDIEQDLEMDENTMAVHTRAHADDNTLYSRVQTILEAGYPICRVDYTIQSKSDGWFAVGVRPYNPEGISFIDEIELTSDGGSVIIEGEESLQLSRKADRQFTSRYQDGDVFHDLPDGEESSAVECPIGMATSALLYRLPENEPLSVTLDVPLEKDPTLKTSDPSGKVIVPWSDALRNHATLQSNEEQFDYLYKGAVRSLIMLSPDWTYPGPYTYKRFWYRDAVFIVYALLGAGLERQAEQILDRFPEHQNFRGYFHSQEGEWDSNGQVIWAYLRYSTLTGRQPKDSWMNAITKGADWIIRKRLDEDLEALHAGLLPSGFSAEHLGNIDHYYWDNYWGVAGLQAAATLHDHWGDPEEADKYRTEASRFMHSIEQSLEQSKDIRKHQGIPASPYRRMDAGAVGSIVAGYPLDLMPATDPRLLGAVEYLLQECFVQGAFFQEMIHSGMNAYLTLQISQILLNAGDPRYADLLRRIAELASPTGQWPEAIHPGTKGGCMGDGHHAWASAEWILMMRRLFIHERGDTLILGGGIPGEWREGSDTIQFGPTPTSFGRISVRIKPDSGNGEIQWSADWRNAPEQLRIDLPGTESQDISAPAESGTVELSMESPIR